MLDMDTLKQHHEDEIHDMHEYHEMAEECAEWRSVLNAMANDERTHAEMLMRIIDHDGK